MIFHSPKLLAISSSSGLGCIDLILLIFPNTTGVLVGSVVSRVITGYLASDIQSLARLQLQFRERGGEGEGEGRGREGEGEVRNRRENHLTLQPRAVKQGRLYSSQLSLSKLACRL